MMSDTPHIEILFFDVGNVLVSDDPSALFIYRRLFDHLHASQDGDAPTAEKFFEYRTTFTQKGGMLWDFVSHVLGEGLARRFQMATRRDLYHEWEKYSPAIPSMEQAVQTLYKEGWRLGILANQPPEVERLLRARKLWDLFEVHAVSDVLGFSKPDPRLFQRALEKAGVAAARSLMIGDRVDNDVAPAKALGMRTMQICLDAKTRGWEPDDDFARAYFESVSKCNVSGRAPANADETPDYVVRSADELVSVIRGLRPPDSN
ncbi:hypothetical protein CVU37_06160 [candidate division BRC1 bacterium HGW-BRC1-1]|jgi:HAD superfamily hydrolase (TIGR01549 family)|nr:MAG: hypothetical protein CVU37_06160 [candidate division BRC1 bacterium HGW-BRC1-1]